MSFIGGATILTSRRYLACRKRALRRKTGRRAAVEKCVWAVPTYKRQLLHARFPALYPAKKKRRAPRKTKTIYVVSR